MASVTFPEELGGNGQTYTDDADPTTGLDGLGYTIRFIPCLQQAVAMGLSAKNDAAAAASFKQQCQTLRQEVGEDRQAVAEDRAAVEEHLQDAQARIGTTQALIDARDTALGAQAGAEDAETGAVTAQAGAEAARDAAVVSGQVYPDTSTGLAATSDEQYFKTVAANQEGFLTLWRNNAGVATEIETYPSLTGIAQALQQANRKQTRLARSLQRLGDHGQTLHSDFDLDAHGLGTALVGGVQDALDSGEMWTTVRETPTLAYQHTVDGSLKYVEAPPNVLAREWNSVAGRYQMQSPLGATNEFRWATKFDNAVWEVSRGYVSNTGLESPIDGEMVFQYTEDETLELHGFAQYAYILAGERRTVSAVIDKNSVDFIQIAITGSEALGGNYRAGFDIKNVASSSVLDAKIIDLNNGFVRLWVVTPIASSDGNVGFFTLRALSDSPTLSAARFEGDGVSGFAVAHEQLVKGDKPGLIIITEDAPVTRAPDQINRTLGPEFNNTRGTIMATWQGEIPPGSNSTIISLNNGTTGKLIALTLNAAGNARGWVLNSGTTYSKEVPANPGINKTAIAWDSDAGIVRFAANGEVFEGNGEIPQGLTQMQISDGVGTLPLDGNIYVNTIDADMLSVAELQEITS